MSTSFDPCHHQGTDTYVDIVDEVEERTLDGDDEDGNRKIAAILEERVMQESGFGTLPFCERGETSISQEG